MHSSFLQILNIGGPDDGIDFSQASVVVSYSAHSDTEALAISYEKILTYTPCWVKLKMLVLLQGYPLLEERCEQSRARPLRTAARGRMAISYDGHRQQSREEGMASPLCPQEIESLRG